MEKRTSKELIKAVMESESCSFWLKEALEKALQRDCVDASHDAEYLAAILTKRANEVLHR